MIKTISPHLFHESIFRAYDIRGVFQQTLFEEDAYFLGRSFASYIQRFCPHIITPRICVGYDGRLSSPSLAAALIRGLLDSGAHVYEIECGPTPLLYFSTLHTNANAGIMITGSHNPKEYNGFKMTLEGAPFFGESFHSIKEIAASASSVSGNGIHEKIYTEKAYLAYLLNAFTFQEDEFLSAAWDTGHGATENVIRQLTSLLPGKHYTLFNEIDGNFPAHHPDPSHKDNLQDLSHIVQEKRCNVGFAFDGDGDRIGIVDEKGNIVCMDHLVMLFAEYTLQRYPGSTIIIDVKTSQKTIEYIRLLGGIPLLWKTGHSFIKQKMKEVSATFAGEISGHLFFKDNNGFDDALYASLAFLSILTTKKRQLSTIVSALPPLLYSKEFRIRTSEQQKFEIIHQLKEYLQQKNISFLDIDGVRCQQEGGFWLIRASNTEPTLTARIEADSASQEKELLATLATVLKQIAPSLLLI